MWRQGDILIQAVQEVPVDSTPKLDLILAEGELTGHVHRIADSNSALLFQKGDDLFLRVTSATATIVHDEHGPISRKRA